MLETPHVAVGAAIAARVANPYAAIALSFLSHFVLDKIPHWNPHFYTETAKDGKPKKESTTLALIDISVALIGGVTIAYTFLPDWKKAALIVICSFASVFSDVVKAPFYYLKIRDGLLKKWVDMERSIQVETSLIPGIITQAVIIAASLYWIYS